MLCLHCIVYVEVFGEGIQVKKWPSELIVKWNFLWIFLVNLLRLRGIGGLFRSLMLDSGFIHLMISRDDCNAYIDRVDIVHDCNFCILLSGSLHRSPSVSIFWSYDHWVHRVDIVDSEAAWWIKMFVKMRLLLYVVYSLFYSIEPSPDLQCLLFIGTHTHNNLINLCSLLMT